MHRAPATQGTQDDSRRGLCSRFEFGGRGQTPGREVAETTGGRLVVGQFEVLRQAELGRGVASSASRAELDLQAVRLAYGFNGVQNRSRGARES